MSAAHSLLWGVFRVWWCSILLWSCIPVYTTIIIDDRHSLGEVNIGTACKLEQLAFFIKLGKDSVSKGYLAIKNYHSM